MLPAMFIKMCVKIKQIHLASYVEVEKLTSKLNAALYTSWVKSPWNYVNFFLEYPLNPLDLELRKMCEPCNSFLAKVRKRQETWVPKSQGESGNFAKKIGLIPWKGVTQFCRIYGGKILFSKSKLTNLKNSGGFFQKRIYILKPPVWSFSGIAHTQQKRQRVPCMSSTRLSRSGLPSLI